MMEASLRADSDWAPACIVDISEGGMAMQSASPPRPGTYVEVRRGSHLMIGRVAWTNDRRFGIRARDRIAVRAILGQDSGWDGHERRRAAEGVAVDWRTDRRRTEQVAQRNQTIGRSIQFAFVAILGMSAAVVGFEVIRQQLSRPMSTVTASLEPS